VDPKTFKAMKNKTGKFSERKLVFAPKKSK
jgi:hypothetical protein